MPVIASFGHSSLYRHYEALRGPMLELFPAKDGMSHSYVRRKPPAVEAEGAHFRCTKVIVTPLSNFSRYYYVPPMKMGIRQPILRKVFIVALSTSIWGILFFWDAQSFHHNSAVDNFQPANAHAYTCKETLDEYWGKTIFRIKAESRSSGNEYVHLISLLAPLVVYSPIHK